MKQNYQRILEQTIEQIKEEGGRPRLLLHACCGPCSSYVLEYLSHYFDITLYFYNPNIEPEAEYTTRISELRRLIVQMPLCTVPEVVAEPYDNQAFHHAVKGLEREPEGGERCTVCYRLRLEQTAKYSKKHGFDYFTTTLSISPYKDAQRLNHIGGALGNQYGVSYLYSDFKKKEGYKRSLELSEQYHLYRQNYCGCIYSKLLTSDV